MLYESWSISCTDHETRAMVHRTCSMDNIAWSMDRITSYWSREAVLWTIEHVVWTTPHALYSIGYIVWSLEHVLPSRRPLYGLKACYLDYRSYDPKTILPGPYNMFMTHRTYTMVKLPHSMVCNYVLCTIYIFLWRTEYVQRTSAHALWCM